MPYTPALYTESAGCVYRTIEGAERGRGFAGLGLIVGIRNLIRRLDKHFYFVTNYHIWKDFQRRALAVRINSFESGSRVLRIESNAFEISEETDLAIAPLPSTDDLRFVYVTEEHLVTEIELARLRIGLGSDVFMIYSAEAIKRNVCGLRFGHVSLLPHEDDKFYRVEMRSVPGHSGSPVCVYDTPNIFGGFPEKGSQFAPLLLGLNRGHEAICEPVGRIRRGKFEQLTDMVSRNNTAIASVVPAWHILAMLRRERFVEQRFKTEAEMGPMPNFVPDLPKVPKGKKLLFRADGTTKLDDVTPEDRRKLKELRKLVKTVKPSASQRSKRER